MTVAFHCSVPIKINLQSIIALFFWGLYCFQHNTIPHTFSPAGAFEKILNAQKKVRKTPKHNLPPEVIFPHALLPLEH